MPDASGFVYDWRRLRGREPARRAAALLRRRGRFARSDLLTYASVVSFRVLFALVPLLLAGVPCSST
jgi:uncharacterized BrkB/YihY/UPF0761 family membrane protein